jgi:hypothetical protein
MVGLVKVRKTQSRELFRESGAPTLTSNHVQQNIPGNPVEPKNRLWLLWQVINTSPRNEHCLGQNVSSIVRT